MGTRASFWIGDPRNLDEREWLGCIAMDGYPDGHPAPLEHAKDAEHFREIVEGIAHSVDHFAHPSGGWPYPWDGDIFLTDFTYAFFSERVWVAFFHHPFELLTSWLRGEVEEKPDDPTMQDVPAPGEYNPAQPDSIIVFRAGV